MSQNASTTLRITLLLAILGAVVGGIAGLVITPIGKLIAGAPPATLANYLVNIKALGIMGAIFGPTLGWLALRRVPLWRAALEPAIGAVLGATLGMLTGSGEMFLLFTGAGIVAATWRVNHAFQHDALRSGQRSALSGGEG